MASWHPNHHHHNQHPADHDGGCCPEEPGVRIRPVTFAGLGDYLEGLANPAERATGPQSPGGGDHLATIKVPRPAWPPWSLGHR
jgi:hypothetical protein